MYYKQIRAQAANKILRKLRTNLARDFVCMAKELVFNPNTMLFNRKEKSLYYNAFTFFVIQHSSHEKITRNN